MQTLESPDITRIAIFGTGECSRRVLAALRPGVRLVAMSDNDPAQWHRQINGVQVVQPGAIPALACDYVVVCSAWAADIVDPLAELGVKRDTILSYYEAFQYDPLRDRELSILRRLIDMRAAARPPERGASPAAPDLSGLERHRRYEAWREEARGRRLTGYFTARHAAVFDLLLGIQSVSNVTGNLLEIGTYNGRSAAMLLLHQAADETLVLVDARESASVNALLGRHPSHRVEYLIGDRRRTMSREWLERRARTCRWIHIDGNHTFPFVYEELECADVLLQDDGLVVMDDAFSPYFPEVTQALYLFQHQHPGRFELLALGDGKAYLARPATHEQYFTAAAPLLRSEADKRGWALDVKRDRDTRSGIRRLLFRA
jgi:predicted O-methyltransferase YrrM